MGVGGPCGRLRDLVPLGPHAGPHGLPYDVLGRAPCGIGQIAKPGELGELGEPGELGARGTRR
ncbi:hypothetical protein ACFYNW_00305 [Streptomyces virginiae]|uniref:hypothetical protein n=1 Tax=Streptomyces virginiae TaxID=1961 RepID=UPI0036E07F4B